MSDTQKYGPLKQVDPSEIPDVGKGERVLTSIINGKAYCKVRDAREKAMRSKQNMPVDQKSTYEDVPAMQAQQQDVPKSENIEVSAKKRKKKGEPITQQVETSVQVIWHTVMGPITAEYADAVVGNGCIALVLKPKAVQMFMPAITTQTDKQYPEIEIAGTRYTVINLGHDIKLMGKEIKLFAIVNRIGE